MNAGAPLMDWMHRTQRPPRPSFVLAVSAGRAIDG